MTLGRGMWAAATGALWCLSLPPWGWWPLAWLGVVTLDRALAGASRGSRFATGFAAGLVLYGISLHWIADFNIAGFLLLIAGQAAIVGLGALLVPPGPGRMIGIVAALSLVEAFRWVWPFGGLPLSSLALGQVGGVLGDAARVGTGLVLVPLALTAGVALAAAGRRQWLAAALAAAVVALIAGLGAVAPDGEAIGELTVAVVQGGGELGTRAISSDERQVFDRHLDAARQVLDSGRAVDLMLWPEDVVDVEGPVQDTEEGQLMAELARDLDATLVAGVVEGEPGAFRNAAIGWDATGQIVDRYDKVHRVPFGEYVPWRSTIDNFVDLSAVPRDAIGGAGAAEIDTPEGRLAVVISFEIFQPQRSQSGVNAGGQAILGPTNASSYPDSIVPSQTLAASRLRAIENGRWLAQASPTGFSAIVDHRGRVHARTGLRDQEYLIADIEARSGQTLAARFGRTPVVLGALALLALAWSRAGLWAAARHGGRRRHYGGGPTHTDQPA